MSMRSIQKPTKPDSCFYLSGVWFIVPNFSVLLGLIWGHELTLSRVILFFLCSLLIILAPLSAAELPISSSLTSPFMLSSLELFTCMKSSVAFLHTDLFMHVCIPVTVGSGAVLHSSSLSVHAHTISWHPYEGASPQYFFCISPDAAFVWLAIVREGKAMVRGLPFWHGPSSHCPLPWLFWNEWGISPQTLERRREMSFH